MLNKHTVNTATISSAPGANMQVEPSQKGLGRAREERRCQLGKERRSAGGLSNATLGQFYLYLLVVTW